MTDFQKIAEEYKPTSADTDEWLAIKTAIFSGLTDAERILWIHYCEIGSYAGLARYFHNSIPTCRKRITEVREKIIDYVFNTTADTGNNSYHN